MSNFNQFMAETQRAIDKETKKMKQKAMNVVLFAHKELVEGTPAQTGLLRNNHIITVNETTTRINDKKDKNNNPTTDQMPKIVKMQFKDGDKIVIQNNLDYMPKIEAFGGSDKENFPPALYDRTEHEVKKFIKELK